MGRASGSPARGRDRARSSVDVRDPARRRGARDPPGTPGSTVAAGRPAPARWRHDLERLPPRADRPPRTPAAVRRARARHRPPARPRAVGPRHLRARRARDRGRAAGLGARPVARDAADAARRWASSSGCSPSASASSRTGSTSSTPGLDWRDVTGVGYIVGGLLLVAAGLTAVAAPRRAPRRTALGWRAAHGAGWLAGAAVSPSSIVMPLRRRHLITHAPRWEIHESALGIPHEEVRIALDDGRKLSAWYVPSRNGAAVLVSHGSGGSRGRLPAPRPHARAPRLRRARARQPGQRRERRPLQRPGRQRPAGPGGRPRLPRAAPRRAARPDRRLRPLARRRGPARGRRRTTGAWPPSSPTAPPRPLDGRRPRSAGPRSGRHVAADAVGARDLRHAAVPVAGRDDAPHRAAPGAPGRRRRRPRGDPGRRARTATPAAAACSCGRSRTPPTPAACASTPPSTSGGPSASSTAALRMQRLTRRQR